MKLNCVDYKFAFYKFKIEFRIKSQLSDKKNIYHFFYVLLENKNLKSIF
jgi:hypothetical protein